jgi:hypothetical protein
VLKAQGVTSAPFLLQPSSGGGIYKEDNEGRQREGESFNSSSLAALVLNDCITNLIAKKNDCFLASIRKLSGRRQWAPGGSPACLQICVK